MGKGKRLKGNKEKLRISEEQDKLTPEIQRITQEVLQDVLENLKDYEGLSEGQIHQKVISMLTKVNGLLSLTRL